LKLLGNNMLLLSLSLWLLIITMKICKRKGLMLNSDSYSISGLEYCYSPSPLSTSPLPVLLSSYLPTPHPPLTTPLPPVWDASSLLILLVERETDLPRSSPLSKSWQVGNRSSRRLLDMCGRGYVPPGHHGGL